MQYWSRALNKASEESQPRESPSQGLLVLLTPVLSSTAVSLEQQPYGQARCHEKARIVSNSEWIIVYCHPAIRGVPPQARPSSIRLCKKELQHYHPPTPGKGGEAVRYYYAYTYSVCICHKWLTVHLCMAKWGFRCQSRNFWLKTSPGSSSNSHAEKYLFKHR